MSDCFHQFEPIYIQEFYSHWKDILYIIKPSSRAKSCVQNIDQLYVITIFIKKSSYIFYILYRKIIAGRLKTAKHRLEQMTIFDVLRSYTETLSLDKLNELKINHDGQELNAIIQITKMEKKSSLKVSEHYIK